jgi:hypothetical protein
MYVETFITDIIVVMCLISRTVVGSNLIHDEVYSMQHYVKKFASDLQ